MSLSFSYRLLHHGWAACTLEIDGAEIDLRLSYLRDGLEDLVGATASLVANNADETVVFVDEPGTHIWKLRPSGRRLRVTITAYDETFARESDPSGRVIFEAVCRLRTFAGAVLAAAQQLLKMHGEDGYRKAWGHDFPSARVESLRAALIEAKERTRGDREAIGEPEG